MIAFRYQRAAETGIELRTWTNPDGLAQGIGPISHGATVHTDVMKTQALKQALDHWGFDAAIGGARRDEEKSRAKERIFSFRNAQHRWDPKHQRPELWNVYNTRIHKGDSVRVFPISNWTELDVWLYLFRESIPVPSLYFARARPVAERDGALIMVDDERLPLREGETPMMRHVRFRPLGCSPLTGAIESAADPPAKTIAEQHGWLDIFRQSIPVPSLYFARERPVVERDGALIMVDDERLPLREGETPMMRHVRFRTLGCYPLTGAIESEADTLEKIIAEMLVSTTSERQGRVIDQDPSASMEKKKQEGYF